MAATTFDEFGCDVLHDDPATPDMISPDVIFQRYGWDIMNKEMPDGEDIRFWALGYENDDGDVPGPLMRVRQNDIVHTHFGRTSGSSHTIHHHGIEPTPMNDGVGHTSFEVNGEYIYQWQPAYAGTYFYHCHKNTTLHFQMGMWAPLIVDPESGNQCLYDPDPGDTNFADTGYDVERMWAVSDVDPEWHHGKGHSAGLCGDDEGLNNFRPYYFLINGVGHPDCQNDSNVVVNANVGDRILIRLINASYSVLKTTIAGLDATIVGVDGRAMRTNAALGDFSQPILVPAGQPIETASAVRYDLIIEPTQAGSYTVEHEFLQWITRERDTRAGGGGIAQTTINVAGGAASGSSPSEPEEPEEPRRRRRG